MSGTSTELISCVITLSVSVKEMTTYIGDDVFEPGIWRQQFSEPIRGGRAFIFGSAIDLTFFHIVSGPSHRKFGRSLSDLEDVRLIPGG